MTTELEETMYEAFKHEFEAFLEHRFEYEELMARFNFHEDMIDKFTERYWCEDYCDGALDRIKRRVNKFFEDHEV